ncbi:MAG: hypothetical protein WD066_17445 [Planctomycetaceae bacterium]
MTYHGRVENGVVVLDDPAALPEGTQVEVTPLAATEKGEPLGKRLLKFAGTVEGLPRDMAEQHDHYIHGSPKR